MPLDSSIYALARLRLDGRRWNELRRVHAQISTQAAADGSSYLEMGSTKVLCTVAGPSEGRRGGGGSSAGAEVRVDISMAGFSGQDRKKRTRGDKRLAEMQSTIANACTSSIFTHLYPHSLIAISLHVLCQDGSILSACLNAATLALIDAGVPMADYIVSCTAGLISSSGTNHDKTDPVLDLTGAEEQELPSLTVATLGATQKVSVLMLENRVQIDTVQELLAVGVAGCKQVREVLDQVVRARGKQLLSTVRG
ncbi:MAG: NAD(+) salvage pathway protein [Watsoniomyces obsoletus]|nr:MAG: NAD(+) salvage pathway protein [Watsoniomyces obsoletus]